MKHILDIKRNPDHIEETMTCDFDMDVCGYSYESSNLEWIIYRKEILTEDAIEEVPSNSMWIINSIVTL